MVPDKPAANLSSPELGWRAGTLSAPVPASGPSGLSDYAVSPLGVSALLLRDEVRVAFLARTSTEDLQDPRQSIVRQLGNCKSALPESWVIVAHFYDVESGRMELDRRGRGTDYDRFDIPIARDGGIADLLDEAVRAGRRFDVVICESVSRVARRAYEGLVIERALERAEVPLFAANEPITLTGSRAQQILQRRINQSVAEYEVLNTLEQSWSGLCTHVREGWNIGKPLYGYKAKTFRHPNPVKAGKGLTKTRLEPDGLRAETVTQIALWRYYEGIGYDTIAERLNADLVRYPPPEPPGKQRARGSWAKTSVYDILRNPKYTGYQVFNRRARKSRGGKVNDPVKWVWSTEPAHEPLIPKWMYDQLIARRQATRGSRDSDERNSHPATTRTYVMRSLMFCACGRRMHGNYRRNVVYYACLSRGHNHNHPGTHGGHPRAIYLREDALLDAVSRFFADQVFGAHRRDILAADLAAVDEQAARKRQEERERLQRDVADAVRRQKAILRQVQDSDPDDPFTAALRNSYNELETRKQAVVARLDAAEDNDSNGVSAVDMALLDALPSQPFDLAKAPEPLVRKLLKSTQLAVQLTDRAGHVTMTIRLPADLQREITHAERAITHAKAGKVLGAQINDLAEPEPGQPVWSYVQQRERSGDRTYAGYVDYAHNGEAERLRGEVAPVLLNLLRWSPPQC
ncbi:DNA invertase Pin-like site-specific DNA recombinase [Kibdelosporangium banguiense]|uniref:DNA invertase Pin-like site-specific DNA recombinase n=1 Tax=Kibdelosporangium banguiense TaxID=1365924 RepID=A0ABS4TE24_9PSEU|nr:recombinase family protein [Kibdelosporangium banguiense]MBP2322667.1 DNA invertase Pin-like site-specific DNA recombinase [Kibdelosporangium banguiense]